MSNRRKGHGGWFAVTLVIGGKPRVFAPRGWLCIGIVSLTPLIGVWYLAATLYLVFHDQLLASLIVRQTDMQYAYEDQIAVLRTRLDREASQGLVDRHTLATTVHDLQERGEALESRAILLDQLVNRDGASRSRSASKSAAPTESRNPLLALDRTDGLPSSVTALSERSERPASIANPIVNGASEGRAPTSNPVPRDKSIDRRADLREPVAPIDLAADALARVERRQDDLMSTLRDPVLRSLARLRAAVAALGLPAERRSGSRAPDDVGGPFVPLPRALGGQAFEQDAALLRDAVAQIARLNGLVSTFPIRKPLDGMLEVSSTFGPRVDPFLGRAAMHTGIDFREAYGETVHATAAGLVTNAGADGGYGMMVEVEHGNGLSTRYAHLSTAAVVKGQKVVAGDVVGRVGSSGRATGPHLHYETRVGGEAVDPTRFLKIGARLMDQ